MEQLKISYDIKGYKLKKSLFKMLSPLRKRRIKKQKEALRTLVGLWEEKDTSFFDKR